MTQTEYILLKLAFTDFGRVILNNFIMDYEQDGKVVKRRVIKDLSKEYVTLVKAFLDEINKDAPDKLKLIEHISKLGSQQYKMYIELVRS